MPECELCDELAGGCQNAYAHTYGHLRRTVLASSHFHAVPTLGQIVEGHLLVIPKRHFCALADLPSDEAAELESLQHRVRVALELTYSECAFFEHGMRGHTPGGCGIDHAHMHAVPVAAHGVLEILRREFGGVRIHSLQEIRQKLPDQSYLYFEGPGGDRHVFPVTNLPSQYMRKLIAESIGKRNWDWRVSGYEPALIATIRRLSPLFSSAAA